MQDSVCPYCQNSLETAPKKKAKCPTCKKEIYVRHGNLMTKAQKIFFDIKERIADLGIEGAEDTKNTDEIWGFLNKKVLEYSQQKQFDDVSRVYLLMGIMTFDEGKYKHCISNYLLCSHFSSLHMVLEDKGFNIKTKYKDLLGAGNYMISSPVKNSLEKISLKEITVDKLGKLAVTPTLTASQKLKILDEVFLGENRRLDGVSETVDENGRVEEVKFGSEYKVKDTPSINTETTCVGCGIELSIEGPGTYKCPECKYLITIEGHRVLNEVKKHTHEEYMRCPKCDSSRVVVQNEIEMKVEHRGCFEWLLWIIAAVCTFGLILIIPLVTNSKVKSKNSTVAVCQQCGYKWKV